MLPYNPPYNTPTRLQGVPTLPSTPRRNDDRVQLELDKLDEPVVATGTQDIILMQGLWNGLQFATDPYSEKSKHNIQTSPTAQELIYTTIKSLIPISGPGSAIPYFYLTLIFYIILRDVAVVFLIALIWSYLIGAVYFFVRAWDFPLPWIGPNPTTPVATYDALAAQLLVFNPLWALVGLLTAVFTVDAFNLEELRSCDLCWELIVQSIILFFLAVKHGEYTAWCVHNVLVPVYALGGVAVWNSYGDDAKGYSSFSSFAPYLFWVLFTWYIGVAWLISNVMIGWRFVHVQGRTFVWSVKGTYGWTLYFSVAIYIFAVSIYRIIYDSV
jgi:hypothetical protein